MNAKTFALLGLAALLAGCATAPAPVAVPVAAECPAPVIPVKPTLPLASLAPASTVEEVLAAYAESLNLCIARSQALETLLNGYKQ